MNRRTFLALSAAAPTLRVASTPSAPPLIVFDGNSLTDTLPDVTPYSAHVLAETGWAGVAAAVRGYGMSHIIARFPVYVHPIISHWPGQRAVVLWEGANDLPATRDARATWQAHAEYCAGARAAGASVVVGTVLPRDVSWPQMDADAFEDARQQFNAIARAEWRDIADGLMDVASDPRIGHAVSTMWYFDHSHLNDAGQTIVSGYALDVLRGVLAVKSPTRPSCLALPILAR